LNLIDDIEPEESMNGKRPSSSDRVFRWLGWLLLIGFIVSILWSMWVDTLQPLIRVGDTRALLFNIAGLPMILLGTGLIVYGGLLFVRGTFTAMSAPKTVDNITRIRTRNSTPEGLQRARLENLKALWDAWKRPLLWLAFGFALIALGGFLINR
jgi:hypothetical protein